MKIAIIDYNAGNVQSVLFALERSGIQGILTNDIETIQTADKVIFSGVGEASTAMKYLKKYGLNTILPQLKQPFLGICLGMQLMCQYSEENDTKCLGIFDLEVKKFPIENNGEQFKVPQIGWNKLEDIQSPLFENISSGDYTYFVHSYYVPLNEFSIANAQYSLKYCAALHRDNFYATQFHPEKSATVGAQIIQNFIDL
jgi:glutamine amidotransferase